MQSTVESATDTQASTLKVGIIVGTTRPGRKAEDVANWVREIGSRRTDATFEVVDIAEHALPHLDEPEPARSGNYVQPHTQAWAKRIAGLDAFVFVTPEYNGFFPGSLKNALDFLYAEWTNKAAGIVSYGVGGGNRAAEQLRTLLGNLEVTAVSAGVSLTFDDDFENFSRFTPSEPQEKNVVALLDELVAQSAALKQQSKAE
ncbi:NADPH-dependent FMN reductase [Goodfellowiella coeruleoviolacea]|uniref:NAD(P)H-dependent FMN reductase n=1 Tax=Goodfellowiella coeruleoviolacea TaxID=334858 RepID=A0AAE3KFC5_9PSEU|nr:NAD(P)H-dependent oxidoreductase [Goodfellowiella coeruleoviolacea]MCP2164810.1 NAD(P)H-dependent FMN reductase [Goodfellowiella coeruleoviolacea]